MLDRPIFTLRQTNLLTWLLLLPLCSWSTDIKSNEHPSQPDKPITVEPSFIQEEEVTFLELLTSTAYQQLHSSIAPIFSRSHLINTILSTFLAVLLTIIEHRIPLPNNPPPPLHDSLKKIPYDLVFFSLLRITKSLALRLVLTPLAKWDHSFPMSYKLSITCLSTILTSINLLFHWSTALIVTLLISITITILTKPPKQQSSIAYLLGVIMGSLCSTTLQGFRWLFIQDTHKLHWLSEHTYIYTSSIRPAHIEANTIEANTQVKKYLAPLFCLNNHTPNLALLIWVIQTISHQDLVDNLLPHLFDTLHNQAQAYLNSHDNIKQTLIFTIKNLIYQCLGELIDPSHHHQPY